MRLAHVILPLLAAASMLASEPTTLTGRVLIQNNGPRTVLAFIETSDAGITHVLRLSAEEAIPQNPVSYQFDRAHVELGADRFAIIDTSRHLSVIFAITPPPEQPTDGAVLLRGHWLSSRTAAPGHTIATIKRAPHIAASFCDATASGDACDDMVGTGATGTAAGTSCTSGGPGAVSCSCTVGSSSCSATCGAGYYAYCEARDAVNGPTCNCVKN